MPTVAALLELNNLKARTDALESQVGENKARATLMTKQAELLGEDAALQKQTREASQAAQAAADDAMKAVTPESTAALIENPTQVAIRDSMQQIQQYRSQAQAVRRSGGDGRTAEKYEQLAVSAEQSLAHNMNLAFNQQKETAKNVASVAGSVLPDGSNVRQVQAELTRLNPNWMRNANVDTVDDIYGNQHLLWGKNTQKYLASMQQQAVTAEKQLDARQKAMDLAFREKQLAATEVERKRVEAREDRKAILARDKLDVDDENKDEDRADRKQARADRAQDRADRAEERRVAKETKAAETKEKAPVNAEVKATTTMFQKDPQIKLGPAQAEAAAWAYHRKVNELVAKGTPREEAETKARDMVVSRIETKTEKGGWFSSDKETREYNQWKKTPEAEGGGAPAGNAFTEQDVKGLGAVGVGVTTSGQLQATAKTPPAKAALIAQANAALNDGKHDRAKVLELLKQQMVR